MRTDFERFVLSEKPPKGGTTCAARDERSLGLNFAVLKGSAIEGEASWIRQKRREGAALRDAGANYCGPLRLREAGFTMVEIAFSLAIVAFALVAIMGVLPTGMTVQKDNREDTIINQDGFYWLEAMRSGSKGIDDLTNYVEFIQITNNRGRVSEWRNTFDNNTQIRSGEQIIGLLSTPKYMNTNDPALAVTNSVVAYVRALNGPAIEKGNPKNEFAFRYRLQSEVTPVLATPPGVSEGDNRENESALGYRLDTALELATLHDQSVMTNLQQFRITMRWPLYQTGTNWSFGNNRRTVRGMMNGRLFMFAMTNTTETNYFVEPNTYAYVPKAP